MQLIKIIHKEKTKKIYILSIPVIKYKIKKENILETTYLTIFKKKEKDYKTLYYFCNINVLSKHNKKIPQLPGCNTKIKLDIELLKNKKKYYDDLINNIITDIKNYSSPNIQLQQGKTKLENYTKHTSPLDPLGCIIKKDNTIYRGIYSESVKYFETLYNTGIIQVLMKYGLLVETKLTDFYTDDFPVIIEHKKVSCIAPQFWTYSKFKEATINTLIILKVLHNFGYSLIDGHNGNVGFDNNKAVQIDLGSIIESQTINKDSICEIISDQIFPMMAKHINSGLAYKVQNILRQSLICNETSFLKSIEFRCVFEYFYTLCDRKSKKIIDKLITKKYIEPEEVDVIFNFIKRDTMWSDYKLWDTNYITTMKDSSDNRYLRLCELIKEFSPDAQSSTDLAGNSGLLSAVLSYHTNIKQFSSIDYDENALEYGLQVIKKEYPMINIGLMNFMRPISNKAFTDFKADIVIAQAVTHHLILTQNYNIDAIFEIIKRYAKKYVYIEFCPLGMWSCKNDDLPPPVPEFYTEQWFKEHFKKHFELLHKETLAKVSFGDKEMKHRVLFIGKINS